MELKLVFLCNILDITTLLIVPYGIETPRAPAIADNTAIF